MASFITNKRLIIGGSAVLLAALAVVFWFAFSTWGAVNRVAIERPADSSGGAVAQPDDDPDNEEPEPVVDSEGLQVYLLVGSDSREDLEDAEGFGDFEGNRADVVMLLLKEGSSTGLLSLPRDLLVTNLCDFTETKLSQVLEGCSAINGPTLVTLTVESLTGVGVDHFAMVDLAGFQEAVDAVGGYEICVENPVRDQRANLNLPAGCTDATGAQTLAWMRSRHTQELVDGRWQTVPGINDLVRNERQRAFLIEMMSRLGDIGSPQALTSIAQTVAPFVTVDSELSIVDAIDLAMTMRGLESGSITELDVPVYDFITDAGASVLLPSVPVREIVTEFLSTAASDSVYFGLGG
jgi:LCP family protein required for cell wall assembly